jgi:DNA primase
MAAGQVRITRELTQAVRDAVDIVDLASEMTRLQRRGRRYLGLCPFHKEKSPSFSVDADAGLYYCFGCGAGGDAIGLYMQGSGDDFPAAIEALARRYGIPLPAAAPAAGPRGEGRDLTRALEAAALYFVRQLAASELARGYLARRQIPEALVKSYGLGYAREDWGHLLKALQGKVPIADLLAAGLVGRSSTSGEPYDRFRHRLMFPIHAPNGRLVGFGGRALGDDKAKYVNTAETAEFHKGRLLYGFHQAKRALRDGRRALLVEGYFDVLGAVASGVEAAVAAMGTALAAEQAALLSRYVDEVVVAYDGDEAGEKAFQRALPLLLGARLHVRRAIFPPGHDPDSLRLEEGPEAVRRLVEAAADGVEVELERLAPPPGKRSRSDLARAAETMIEVLRPVRDEMVRRTYSRRAAERLGVPEDVFLRRLGPQLYAVAPGRERAREVVDHEERALQLLLQGARLPSGKALPPQEIFFDADCRNIYAAFCALYKDGGESPPPVEEVLARLDDERGAVDRIARLLLEEPSSEEGDVAAVLSTLVQRWQKQRQGELIRQIRQAEERGDQARRDQLLEEKTRVLRSLHPGMTGRVW